MVLSKVQVTPMIHNKRTFEWEMTTPTPHKPHLSSCTSSFFLSNHFSSEDFFICFWPTVDRSLSFSVREIMLLHCYCLAHCGGSTLERKVVVCPFRTHTLHCERTPWFGGHRDIRSFTGYEPKYTSMAHRNLMFRTGSRRYHSGKISQEVR